MADDLHNTAAETETPPPGILISDHFDEPYGYKVNRAHGTRDWIITLTLAGKGLFSSEAPLERIPESRSKTGFVCSALAGDVVILAPGVPHHYCTVEKQVNWNFVWAHFVPRPHWSQWLKLPESAKGLIHLRIDDEGMRQRIHSSFQRILVDSKGATAFHEELALNALEEIVLLLAEKYAKNRTQSLDTRIDEVIQILTHHMSAPHTVTDLAKRVSLSPSRLAHIFKEQTGDSIMETLLNMRLRQAARMLEFTTRQITEIAQDIGFQSLYYFSRQFSKYYGTSPTAYRNDKSNGKE